MGEAVVVALAECEAVRHGGGVGRLGPADVDPPVPEDLLESLCDGGLPDRRGLVPPQAQPGLHGRSDRGRQTERAEKHFRAQRDQMKDW